MSTHPELPTLTADIPAMPTPSPSLSSISTSSDDAPQLSFEYIWDDDGNFVRLSKRGIVAEDKEQNNTQPIDAEVPSQTSDALLNDVLGNDRTAENAQSISSVLSFSHNVPSTRETLSSTPPLSRTFQRAVSGPVVTLGTQRSSLLPAGERPLVRARRVPIEEKRKEEAEFARKTREEEEREREVRKLRMREKEKENWAGGVDVYVKGESNSSPAAKYALFFVFTRILCPEHHARSSLASSSLARTQSDPSPSLLPVPEQPEHRSSQLQPADYVPYRQRRPLSKQQRVLSAVPRVVGKESPGVRTSSGSIETRTSAGSVEASRAC